jgi:hypothetical protein
MCCYYSVTIVEAIPIDTSLNLLVALKKKVKNKEKHVMFKDGAYNLSIVMS